MYENRLIYSSLQASDQAFFAKVLLAIDNALQIHWRSCSITEDRRSVNDRILLMSDIQDSILRHNFVQQIPKSISDKILNTQDILKDGKVQGGGKFQGKQDQGNNIKGNGKLEIVSDNDKNHSSWRAKNGKDFTKVFYKNQRQCLRTHDGKPIGMKFFIRGFCDKSCSHTHKLSSEDEKAFSKFVMACHEGASKPDF